MKKKKIFNAVVLDDGDMIDLIDAVGWGAMHLAMYGKGNENWKVARLIHLKRILGILQISLGKGSKKYYEPALFEINELKS